MDAIAYVNQSMNLSHLLSVLPDIKDTQFPDLLVSMLSADSRKILPGGVFICIKGARTNGHLYAEKAIQKGAVAIICQDALPLDPSIVQIVVPSTKEAMSLLMQEWTGQAWKKMKQIAVTGTTAKTTIAHIIYQMLNHLGTPCGLIGTAGTYIAGEQLSVSLSGPVTTPQPEELHPLFDKMYKKGCRAVSLEASSFGLSENRLHGMEFDVAILSNVAFNHHIGFHGGWQDYLEAKKILFCQVKSSGTAVLNGDDVQSSFFHQDSNRQLYYGSTDIADVRISDLNGLSSQGISFELNYHGNRYHLQSHLVGAFQAWNLAAAFTAGIALGYDPVQIVNALASIQRIPGRWDCIPSSAPYTVVVDKANTPLALHSIRDLVLQPQYSKRIAVFGNVGGGDYAERILLAQLLADMFDFIVLTLDDPEDEDIWKNFDEFLSGLEAYQRKKVFIVPSRKLAFNQALDLAEENALIAILGRGNQREFIYKNVQSHFDDLEVIQSLLNERGFSQ